MSIGVGLLLIVIIVGLLVFYNAEQYVRREKKYAAMSPEERLTADWGNINSTIVCPTCHTSGNVRTKRLRFTKAVSTLETIAWAMIAGGGVGFFFGWPGALVAGGISILLPREEKRTRAYCANCRKQWKMPERLSGGPEDVH
jgi:hypothetical protein